MIPNWIAVSATAKMQFRRHWRSIAAIIVLATIAAALMIDVRALTGPDGNLEPSLAMPRIASRASSLLLTPTSQPPAATQALALRNLLMLLGIFAWMGFGVAAFSILAASVSQTLSRQLEYGVQRAVGASIRLVRHAFTLESAATASIAVTFGAAGGVAMFVASRHAWPADATAPDWSDAALIPALVVTLVIASSALVAFGAMRTRHLIAPPDQEVGLKIPMCQLAAAVMVVLATAALLERSSPATANASTASPTQGIVLSVDSGIADLKQRSVSYESLMQRLATTPGVASVGIGSGGALLGLGTVNLVVTDCGRCSIGAAGVRWLSLPATTHAISSIALRPNLHLIEGEDFRAGDVLGMEPVAIIHRAMARNYFERGHSIGRHLYIGEEPARRRFTVIGVVDDEVSPAIGGASQPGETVYVSALQLPPSQVDVVVRGTTGTPQFTSVIRAVIHQVLGARAVIQRTSSEADAWNVQHRAVSWFGNASAVAGALVLLMALLGTFTTIASWSRAIAWELALRRAVGARRRHIVSIMVSRTSRIAIGGAAGGIYGYGLVIGPALRRSVPHLALPGMEVVLPLVVAPMLLTVVGGSAAGLLTVLRHPPITLLR